MRRQRTSARWRGGGSDRPRSRHFLAAVVAVLALLLSWLPPVWAPVAAAVPAGSEYPANWSISGNTATGTTPSGVVVTATVGGAVNAPTQGDIIFTGTRPSYLPSGTSALRLGIANCTNTATSGCGSITYTFSQPVRTPILYIGAVGGYTSSTTIASYHDHPVTLASGTFSLDSSGSQSPRMGIWNGSSTVGIVNPQQYVGTSPGDGSSCGIFGCGAYDIATTTPTITSLTLYYGYEGSGNNLDGFNQILGITPATTSLSLTKSASPSQIAKAGDTVTYSYQVTNTGEVPVTNPRINESSFSGTGTKPSVSCPTGSLGVGASVTCTVTYTATQADVDAGRVTNTATATATPPSGMTAPVSNSSTATVTATQNPALTVEKTVAETGDLNAGQTLHYSFKVTNTGNVTLSPVRINETAFTGSGGTPTVTCPNVQLAPGTSLTCTATYTVTQADVDAGTISNTATATGTPPNNGTPVTSTPSTVVVPFTARPALTVAKTADKQNVVVGDVITYSYKVTNTGNVTMRNVSVAEGTFSGTGTKPTPSCPAAASSLAPGASVTCTATYTVTQADVDAGKISNAATASGTPPNTTTPITSPPGTTTVTTSQRPALTVVKTSDRTDLVVGQTVTYSFKVTNTGNVTLKNVTPKEGTFSGTGTMSAISCPAAASSLAPGASVTCTATYVVTQADVDAGKVTNTATATGVPPGTDTPVESPPSPPNTITGTQKPALTVVKTADRTDLVVGQTVTYSYKATNTGNVTLTNLTVDEGSFSGTGTMSAITCPANWLAPGASTTCTSTYTVTQADVDAGKLTNTATASGTPPNTTTPITSPPGTTTITGTPKPALTVVKSADRTNLVLGDTITYSFKVTNTGNVTMRDIAVQDSDFTGTGTLSAISCPTTTLAPGASTTCTATYKVTQADVDAGTLSNSATATGVPPNSTTPTNSPPSTTTVPGTQTPSLKVEKSSDRTDLVVGETVTYSFKVTNTGNVTLKNVAVQEGSFSGTGSMSAISCPAGASSLPPGAAVTCTATYVVTQADVDAGKVTNTATANGVPPGTTTPIDSPPSPPNTITGTQKPALKVTKAADKTVVALGDVVTYTFTVTNTGNVTMTDVAIKEGDFSGTGTMSAPVCSDGAKSLAPGASTTCTATYTITQADVDAGKVTNSATANGVPPNSTTPVDSPPTTTTVTVDQKPALKVEKSSDRTDLVVGQTVTYSFKVTNTGNVTMADVSVKEGDFSGTGTMSAITCPDAAKSLAPGASVTCTATYVVTQADVDAGKLTNSATPTGTPPGSTTPQDYPPGTSTLTGTQTPGLTVVKTADKTDLVVGETITYSFKATNTGNVTLKDVTIKEGDFSGTGTLSAPSCPDAAKSLAPGASVTCTATYVVTQADVDAGTITNSATGTGVPPGTTTPITSDPSTAKVPGTQTPSLKVEKSSDRTDLVVGETVTYSFKVTNTGNVTLKEIAVKEGEFSGSGTMSAVTCPAGSLAPGAAVTCTATYTVTQADVDAGKVTNTATATGVPPGTDTPVESPPSPPNTITGTQKPALEVVKAADKTQVVLGDAITYTFTVTNTGNVTLKDVTIKEGDFSGTGSMSAPVCSDGAKSLAPGASTTCTATYTVTQADVDAGKITNSATSTGVPPQGDTPVTSPPGTSTVTVDQKPGLKVEKTADKSDLVVGETVTYSFKATNTGNVTLKDVAVKEGDFSGTGTMSAITCPDGAKSLAPGASVTCTATYVVTQADVDAGKLTNSATATGVPPNTTTPIESPPTPSTIDGTRTPGLKLEKSADRTDLVVGQTVTYSFKVTNTGNVTMKDVAVKEGDFSGTGELSEITCPDGAKSLAPGASVTCTATYVVTQADVDAGKLTNSATPTGTPPGSTTPQDYPPGTTTVTGTPEPGLKVEKSADKSDLVVGETVTYSFKATNTGNVTLKDVTVKEGTFSGTGQLSPITCPDGAKSLAPGASVTCTATYVVTQADVDAGKVTNTATATGVPPGTDTPIESPPSPPNTITGTPEPGLKVEKSADKSDLVVGETVTYSFKATNTGNVTLKNVTIQDADFSGTGTMSAITCPDGAKSLAPGASVTCTATYVVTQADVDAGKLTNSATGTAVPPGTNTPTSSPPAPPVTITGTHKPGLTVEKTADKNELVAGETITFSFKATNTGNVTLTNVTVHEGDFNGTGVLSAPTCPDAAKSLAPGASVTCTATYVVTQADVDAGQLENSATVTGEPPLGGDPITSPPGTTKVPSDARPGLTVVKSADKNRLVAGETITYSFVVTNTGNVTMKEVAVQEGEFTGSGTLSDVSCPDGAKSLAPGASVTCTATYEVTQDDVDAGTIDNSATGTGVPPAGPPYTSPPGRTTVPTDPKPGLSVTKTASPDRKVKAGETITYSFLLANTGNVTLLDARPVEGEFTGTGKISPINCPDSAAKLIPGQRVTCTATYQVTEADAKSSRITNAATGTARVPGGNPPPQPPTSTVTVTTEPPPTPELPETGEDFSPVLIGLAVSLAAAGGVLLLVVRRRRG
ncbi:DUF11 domain-containing protein [Streptomyces roseirectus]|uniref:DUF11 domain-containing protein n=1 Tax=Streptomyces roseirectus TaxID=2768066 RepID=A0A7H0IGZ9_9ACTN|nr:LPXTG cell wall anchor domain-containing protein [Streptomyces roseirectus]QNP72065.1 DUF11 domain-containing protein [Streptomyces roseirectus]